MKYKTPKELEQVPIIAGLELKKVIFIVVAALAFVFLMVTNIFIASLLPILVGVNIYLSMKFKKQGEFQTFLKYSFGSKVILFDKTIEELVNNNNNNKKEIS